MYVSCCMSGMLTEGVWNSEHLIKSTPMLENIIIVILFGLPKY